MSYPQPPPNAYYGSPQGGPPMQNYYGPPQGGPPMQNYYGQPQPGYAPQPMMQPGMHHNQDRGGVR
ncbi:hypothetical protein B0A53_01883 [Rhodotorula sp. CCFEE 5036]|nr:hypothetical protein B0A53_01883 [Rhodotorula sp. CCFEE 5036]